MAVLLDEIEAKARAFAGLAHEDNTHGLPYFAPSDEPLSWDVKGKTVRLDVAMNAIHIFCARIAFRSLTGAIKQKIIALEKGVLNWLEAKAFLKALGTAGTQLLSTLRTVQQIFDEIESQKVIEQAIRRQSLKIQRDLKEQWLGKGKPTKRRRTKTVWSRHFTPYQRKKRRGR